VTAVKQVFELKKYIVELKALKLDGEETTPLAADMPHQEILATLQEYLQESSPNPGEIKDADSGAVDEVQKGIQKGIQEGENQVGSMAEHMQGITTSPRHKALSPEERKAAFDSILNYLELS